MRTRAGTPNKVEDAAMTVLAAISAALIAVAAGLYVAMFRRDDAMLGLAGLTLVITAA